MQYRRSTYAEDAWDVYWYEKNLLGDVVAIYNSEGARVGRYLYSAYGATNVYNYATTTGQITYSNPFRYRGYYYDPDIGLYYLQSRYYDPYTCRFISPDSVKYLGANGDLMSYNLYAYCSNNPVMYTDPTGTTTWGIVIF